MIRIKQRNKVILILIIVISVSIALVFAGIESPKTAIQRKMVGLWNIEFENSAWDRYKEYDIGTIMSVESKDTIELPFIYGGDKPFFQKKAEATGAWKVISTNPDSVFFDVPENPLHGKYAVWFFIAENGWSASIYTRNNIYKMELKNDSTVLICNKAGVGFRKDYRNWESKND